MANKVSGWGGPLFPGWLYTHSYGGLYVVSWTPCNCQPQLFNLNQNTPSFLLYNFVLYWKNHIRREDLVSFSTPREGRLPLICTNKCKFPQSGRERFYQQNFLHKWPRKAPKESSESQYQGRTPIVYSHRIFNNELGEP